MTASAAEAPEIGRTRWPTDAAEIASAAYASIQAPVSERVAAARAADQPPTLARSVSRKTKRRSKQ